MSDLNDSLTIKTRMWKHIYFTTFRSQVSYFKPAAVLRVTALML